MRLISRYAEIAADTDLSSMRHDLALLDTRLGEVIERLETGEHNTLWNLFHSAFKEWRQADDEGDERSADKARRNCERLTEQGVTEQATWAEIRDLLEQRRRIAESENKRLKDLQHMIPVERALLIVARISASIRTHVTDPHALALIQADLRRTLDDDDGVGTS